MAAIVALLGTGLPAGAQPPTLQWQGGGCGEDWQVDTPVLPLRAILEQLAVPMGFELRYLAQENPQREGRFQGDAGKLLRQLAGRVSLITTVEQDPQCPGGWRLVRVIVLPEGQEGELPPATEYVPEGMQLYRRAHGMDPQTGEPVGRESQGEVEGEVDGEGQ